ncbi:MAG: hypothetical protein O0X93_00750 [Methanocorpusculum sp.]|nr:hypothetical protein [Methanocorpusculum sp.]MDE2521672.1 hypothetical protein [Methanocorpusculum sp.]MDE2523917.1 hypothetical protein [Methanocorpusculum sp.]
MNELELMKWATRLLVVFVFASMAVIGSVSAAETTYEGSIHCGEVIHYTICPTLENTGVRIALSVPAPYLENKLRLELHSPHGIQTSKPFFGGYTNLIKGELHTGVDMSSLPSTKEWDIVIKKSRFTPGDTNFTLKVDLLR